MSIDEQLDLTPAEPEKDTPFGEFDWVNSSSVVLREQPETAVYFNPEGALVIRQRDPNSDMDDPFVYIQPNNQAAFLDALCDAMGVPSIGGAK